ERQRRAAGRERARGDRQHEPCPAAASPGGRVRGDRDVRVVQSPRERAVERDRRRAERRRRGGEQREGGSGGRHRYSTRTRIADCLPARSRYPPRRRDVRPSASRSETVRARTAPVATTRCVFVLSSSTAWRLAPSANGALRSSPVWRTTVPPFSPLG